MDEGLPPLPEHVAHVHSNGDFCWDRNPEGVMLWPRDLYTAEAMRSYAEAAVLQERERCAKMADAWKRADAVKLAAGEMTAGQLRTAQAVAAGIAAAIRAVQPTKER